MLNTHISQEEWLKISQIFSFFSHIYYKEPSADYCKILPELFDSEWCFEFQSKSGQHAYENLQSITSYNETHMIVEYNALFVCGQPLLAPPWASVYLNKHGEVFDDETIEVRKFYKKCGLEYDNILREPEDHMGLELIFCSYMSSQMAETTNVGDKLNFQLHLIDFLEIHLIPWSNYFFDLVASKSSHDFYRNIAILTNDYLKYIIITLNLHPKERIIYDHY